MKRFPSAAALALILAACASTDNPPAERQAQPLLPGMPVSSAEAPEDDLAITRVAFGSCLKQGDPMPILAAMVAAAPDLTVLLGDNVYGDVKDPSDASMPELRRAYGTLSRRQEFIELTKAAPIMATWDDHDYGANDRGGDFPLKEEAERLFETFWNLPPLDPARSRPGVHQSRIFGPEGRRVQVILLDTRFFRSPLTPTDEKGAPGKERYLPSSDPGQTMLGAEQEAWLAGELRKPADLRILVSSVQVLADGHGWEAWRTLPEARRRLFSTIEEAGARNVILVSGDRHLGGLYRDEPAGFPMFELTASSLNAPQSAWREESGNTEIEAGPNRLGTPVYDENFGLIDIAWDRRVARLSVRGLNGEPLRTTVVPF